MKGAKLINILKTFSTDEMKMLEKFVASPFHSKGLNCTAYFKQLQKLYPDFNKDKLTDEILYKKLFPRRKFNKQVMWNLTSAMGKMINEFLEQAALRKHEFIKKGLILSEFENRKLLINYSQTLAETEKLLETRGIDYEYFDAKGHLENYKQIYYHSIDKIQPMGSSKLKASEYQILLFLRMTVGGLNDMKVLSENHNYRFDVNIPLEFAKNLDLEKIVDYAKSKNFEYAFLIEIYYHSIMMLLKPEQTRHLDKVRELYALHYNKFTMSEKRSMMHWIVNYCTSYSDYDEIKYQRIIFELNEFRLKEGFAFYPENQLPKAIYIQILNSALAVMKPNGPKILLKIIHQNFSTIFRIQSDAWHMHFCIFTKKNSGKFLNT